MELPLINLSGKGLGKAKAADGLCKPASPALISQVAMVQNSRERVRTADTKERADVRGGGRKPWKQKGTGRARHGSIRSPLWTGGGVDVWPTLKEDGEEEYWKRYAPEGSVWNI